MTWFSGHAETDFLTEGNEGNEVFSGPDQNQIFVSFVTFCNGFLIPFVVRHCGHSRQSVRFA